MALLGRFRRGFARLLTPYLVLAFGFALSAAAGLYVYESSHARDEARFISLVNEVEDAITKRIDTYTAILRAGRGFVATQPRFPSVDAFMRYAGEIGIETHYPGVQGLGYSVRVPTQHIARVEAHARSQGLEDFRVWPQTPTPHNDTILYLYPLDRRNRAALGFNMGSEARRSEAMDRARDTGEPAATGRVTLVQEIDERKQSGFLIYVPVYENVPKTLEERRGALLGFIYSPFRSDDLLQEIVRNLAQVDLEVYDVSAADPANLLHRSEPSRAPLDDDFEPAFSVERVLTVAGRPWTLKVTSRPEFERASGRNLGVVAFFIGTFFSFILYALARSLYRAWYAAETSADELRNSEDALRARGRELNTLIKNTPDIVARFDRGMRHVFVNDSVAAATGKPAAEFIGKTSRELGFTGPVLDLFEGAIAQVFGTARPAEIEFSLTGPDGIERHFQSRLVPEFADDGSVVSVLSVARDITGLKQAETRVRRNAGHMQMLAEISRSFAAARLDMHAVADQAVHFVTGRIADVAVFALVDQEGKNIIPLAYAHVDPRAEHEMQARMDGRPAPIEGGLLGSVIQSGEPLVLSRFDSKNESFGPATFEFFSLHPVNSIMIIPLKVSGRTIGAFGVGLVGPQSSFGIEDQDIIRDLADRAALALENARLYDEAQRAIRLRDEFLSIASHELKTPLTPLQLQVQNLQRIASEGNGQVSPERLKSFASVTDRQVQRLTGLVNSLLDVSRIGAGKFELEPERFDLVPTTREIIERFALEAERTQTEFRLHADAPVTGTWDRMRIEQVITNLVSNALKYGEHKPVDVFVGEAAGWAELRVVDHGIGLPGDFADRAFERFTRAVSTRSYGGLGLGLYIVKQIVLAHGGEVTAQNGDEGTTFTVRLPLELPKSLPQAVHADV